MSENDFECPLEKIELMEAWVTGEDPDPSVCRPCLIEPLAELYLGVLEEAKETKLAEELKQSHQSGDVLTIARAMDRIKASVGTQELRSSFEQLDCMAQTFKETQKANDNA